MSVDQLEGAVDLAALTAWMDGQGLGEGPIEEARLLAGGTQNILLRFRRGDLDVVLRRGPRHLRPATNKNIRREMQVLGALRDTDVPHPRLVAACPDESVLGGAVFYLMEPLDGVNPSQEVPEAVAADPALRHALGLSVIDALAAIGSVDHKAVGLEGVGHPEGFLERQVPRWLAELESYSALEGYPGPDIGDVHDLARWLEEHRPADGRPGIMHGDFHLANVMVGADGLVTGVVDWEMATVGDPLLDLGWLTIGWPDPTRDNMLESRIGALGGLPSAAEITERYAERSGRDLTDLNWYIALGGFKIGIVLEGTHARACAGLAPEGVGDRLHRHATELIRRAHEAAAGG
ncbi:phosphotransferase family protein [Nocardioides insulae]|uniref:phosphotransferase family protein n=1 Tax=Nocardioides insulae TaxID=394734 RepID=UPI000415BBA7|nr:phosphotransferase family protein [Nocardioides insulae]